MQHKRFFIKPTPFLLLHDFRSVSKWFLHWLSEINIDLQKMIYYKEYNTHIKRPTEILKTKHKISTLKDKYVRFAFNSFQFYFMFSILLKTSNMCILPRLSMFYFQINLRKRFVTGKIPQVPGACCFESHIKRKNTNESASAKNIYFNTEDLGWIRKIDYYALTKVCQLGSLIVNKIGLFSWMFKNIM